MTQLKPGLKTLRSLLEEHPEWADLPCGILLGDGTVDYVGWAGSVFITDDADDEYSENEKTTGSPVVLLFAPN